MQKVTNNPQPSRISRLQKFTTILFGIAFLLFTILIVINLRATSKYFHVRHEDKSRIHKIQIDHFEDLFDLLKLPISPTQNVVIHIAGQDSKANPRTLGDFFDVPKIFGANNLVKFHLGINENGLYQHNDDPLITNLLHDLKTMPIVKMVEMNYTTHFNMIAQFKNGMKAVFKPIIFPREQQTDENHLYFSDHERANAEIAAFHLDRVLGFHRVLPSIGRKINVETEILNVTDNNLQSTFFKSPINNTCFYGKECYLYCDDDHIICGNSSHHMEGVFTAFLPDPIYGWQNEAFDYPWRRTNKIYKKARWETDNMYCSEVANTSPYNTGRLFLDFMDTAVFDFLMGNLNRHYYNTFGVFNPNSYAIHVNNARGFGKAFVDDLSILAPIYQCCKIRHSTLKTLLNFHAGPMKLSKALEISMKTDPLSPVLWEPHLHALDRRVEKILKEIRKCIEKDRKRVWRLFD